jgi:hypothetical protein
MEGFMRFSLPILLLTASAAMAQSQPALADKPFINDGPGLNGFTAPAPVTIVPGPGQEKAFTPPSVDNQARMKNDRNQPRCMRPFGGQMPAGCQQGETPKSQPAPKKSFG